MRPSPTSPIFIDRAEFRMRSIERSDTFLAKDWMRVSRLMRIPSF
jgi:hypothetical protein